ncbi:hypothetical protein AQUCO_00200525v1, partial [Aquilegia coerulea]
QQSTNCTSTLELGSGRLPGLFSLQEFKIMKAIKEESNGSANTVKSKLRYPLRSATKKKDDKSAVTDTASSSPKRGKPQSSVGKSVGFLDISENDKPAKPTRRLSARAKSSISPLPKSTGTINSSSDSRSKRANKGQRSNEKPVSDVSKSFSRKKFSVLSSVSYWLSQIKLSESAVKHSVSLGFFKLALDSGCEPLQRMCDELKLYVSRHSLVELGEPLKELLTSYKTSADMEQLQVSETCPQVSEESTQSLESVHSTSIDSGKKLKPKAFSSENVQLSTIAETAKRRSTQRISASKNRGSVNRNPIKSCNVPQKNSQRPSTEVTKKEKSKTQKQGENSAVEKVDTFFAGGIEQDDKENKDTQQPEESSLTEAVN